MNAAEKISKYLFVTGVVLMVIAFILAFFIVLSFLFCYSDARGPEIGSSLCQAITFPGRVVENTVGSVLAFFFGPDRKDEAAGAFFFGGLFLIFMSGASSIFFKVREKFGWGIALSMAIGIIILAFIGSLIM